MVNKKSGIIILLTVAVLKVFGVNNYQPKSTEAFLENWRWHHLQELDGFGVRDITQDHDNNIWFAAEGGVYKYNGYRFKQFDLNGNLDTNHVNCIYSSKIGLLAASSYELFYFTNGKWQVLFGDQMHSFKLSKIKELPDGNIYCMANEGFLRIDKNKQITVYTSQSLVDNHSAKTNTNVEWKAIPDALQFEGWHSFSDIILDRTGWYWLCQDYGEYGRIIKFNGYAKNLEFPNDYQVLSKDNGYKLGREQQLLYASDGTVWVTNGHFKIGINRFTASGHEYIKLGELYGGDEYHWNIEELNNGEVIISGLGKFYLYKNNSWNYYQAKDVPIPPSCRIMAYKLNNNDLIIGGLQNKIFYLDYGNSKWKTYADLNFQFSTNKAKWFIDKNGKVVVDSGNQWTSFTTIDGLMDTPVKLICTSKGQIWAAGSHKGIAATARLKNNKWERFLHPELSWGIDYRAVFEDSSGAIWFGCAVDIQSDKGQKGGVVRTQNPEFEKIKWEHFYAEHGLAIQNAYGIGQSPDGRIWLGGNYLLYFNQQSWQKLLEPLKLNDYINDIKSVQGSSLWVGSRYYGIFTFDGNKWTNFDINSGLSSNTIISIYVESDSSVWVATDNDIAYYNGKDWAVELFPDEMKMTMEGGSVLLDENKSLWINKSSREWKRRAFPFSKASNAINENFITYRYIPDNGIPETYLNEYVRKVTFNSPVTFFWKGKDLYKKTPDSKLKFSYRLNNGEWSEFTDELNTTFYKLKPGEYTFEVKARDMDRNEDLTPAIAEFKVLSPVWLQGWFIALLISMLVLIAFFANQIFKRDRILREKNDQLNIVNETLNLQKSEIDKKNEKLNEMLVKNDELAQSKMRFYTNISHEFRTPLTLILGYIDSLIDNKIERNDKPETYKIIRRSSFRLLQLVNQILEFRKIESGNLKIKIQKGNLGKFIEELSELFMPLARKRCISFYVSNKTTTEISLFDHDKLEKIVFNLLSNAFKYCPDDGNIKVQVENAEYNKTDAYKITVSDTGEGIDAEHLEHLFERFYNDGNETKQMKDFDSSGIGLSYAKDLIGVLGGQILVESKKGQGASFICHIPIIESVHENDQSTTPEYKFSDALKHSITEVTDNITLQTQQNDELFSEIKKTNQKLNKELPTVLIVEDNNSMRDFIIKNISKEYNIIDAENGQKALELINEYDFDLIVSDIMMPVMDGIELCKSVKTTIETSHIPVILLTAKSLDENIIEGYTNLADDYIIKPFNAKLLLTRMKSIIGNREAIKKKFSGDLTFEPKDVKLPSMDKEFLSKLLKLIEDNVADPEFSIEKMSEMMAISRTHFIRKVKKLTNSKPLDLLINYRLKMARQLLQQKKASISEVAFMVGYDNPSSFSRAFKNRFGISPSKSIQE